MRNKRKGELFLDIVNLDDTTPEFEPPRQKKAIEHNHKKANKSINYMGKPPVKFIGTPVLGGSQDFGYGDWANTSGGGSEGALPVIGKRGLGYGSFGKSPGRGSVNALRIKRRVANDFGPS
jgi:hypothetical protein